MADIHEIKEGARFFTPKDSAGKGRIGIAYAVTEQKKEKGLVDLFFDGPCCMIEGPNWAPPSGIFKIEILVSAEDM